MAAVSIPPSPHAIGNMASRRIPLSTVPNAGNSPWRSNVGPVKRSRSQTDEKDSAYGQPPPLKKKIVEATESPNTPRKKHGQTLLDTIASRHEKTGASRTNTQARADENTETLRQWQNHYRKAFPGFVFYFDSVPDDARRQCVRNIQALGARQEKFFSKDVTHVITTRSIPVETLHSPIETNDQNQRQKNSRTINPSLLERSAEQLGGPPKSKFTFEQSSTKRIPVVGQDKDEKQRVPGQVDMLHRAKEMRMKIWQVEKLQRIISVIFDEPTSPQGHPSKSHASQSVNGSRSTRQPDLSQLIKNEQLNGPSEREANIAALDVVPFKGFYIYIRDMNEKTKPIMAREYPKVHHREDGEWPQFRSVSVGKCPFIEEDLQSRRHAEKARAREEVRQARVAADAPATRSRSAAIRMEPPLYAGRKRPLAEIENGANVSTAVVQRLPKPATNEAAFANPAAGTFQSGTGVNGREPMASGMQASNITSAIRSQMISSTAAAPGAKAGTSREIHGLQRKVLERNNGSTSAATLQQARGIPDVAAAARANPRLAKQKAQEKLGHKLTQVHEDTPSEDEVATEQAVPRPITKRTISKERRDPKPGYCENCREKFDDFDEHTLSRRHRKFATSKENWKELDSLLSVLGRPQAQNPIDDTL